MSIRKSQIAFAILTTLSAPSLLAQALSSASPQLQRSRHGTSEAAVAAQADPAPLDASNAGPSPAGGGQTVLYDQTQTAYPDDVLSFDARGSNAGFGIDSAFAADDFFISDPDGWTVNGVDIDGTFRYEPGHMSVDFFADDRGLPGPIPLCHYFALDYSAPGDVGTIRRFTIPLPRSCDLPPGETWVSVVGYGIFTYQGGYYWAAFSPDPALGNEAAYKGLSASPCPHWTPLHNCGFSTSALGFKLIGSGRPTSFDEVFTDGFDGGAGGTFFQPVQDTGFEASNGDGESNPYWLSDDGNPSAQSGGTVFYSDVAYPIPVYQGQWEIWFGGWNNQQAEIQTVSQTFTIASGGPRYLHYWRFIQTPPDGSGNLTISVDGTAVSTLDIGVQGADANFGEHVIDVSSYADTRPHTIEFEYDNDGVGNDGRIFIDWVTISDTADAAASADLPKNAMHIPFATKRG